LSENTANIELSGTRFIIAIEPVLWSNQSIPINNRIRNSFR